MSDINLSRERYLAALIRIRNLIANGLPLDFDDDTTPGAKHMYCDWGLCSDKKDAWPDPQDYQWPDQPDRVTPKHRTDSCLCPLDKRSKHNGNGCFYSCRIFQPKIKNLPTREEVLALYDKKIAETEAMMSAARRPL